MSNTYDIGDGVRLTATFLNLSGTITDPTTVVFRIVDPTGLIVLLDPIKLSAGVYYVDYVTTVSGTYSYRWEGTGTVQAAAESQFKVRTSFFFG